MAGRTGRAASVTVTARAYNLSMEEEKTKEKNAGRTPKPGNRFVKLEDGRLLDKATGLVFDDIEQFRTVSRIGAEFRKADERARAAAKKRRKEQKAARRITRLRRK